MTTILVLLLTVPVAAALAAFWLPPRAGQPVTAVTGVASFAAVTALVPAAAHHDVTLGSYLRVDALSVVFMLATSFLYGAVAIYLIGYLRTGDDQAQAGPARDRYGRRLLAGVNVFAWSMLAAPMMNSLALLWVAVEVTTVVSALLVALEGTDGAAEAAWKYVLVASAGLGVALLGTIFAYYAGEQVLGQSYALGFVPLLHAAAHLPPAAVRLMFVLAVLGFGTKVGLFPVHTWLPDAHSEAPAPVSALLSGSLLAVSFYAILRYYQVAQAALGTGFPRAVLLTFGVATLALAALCLLDQRDLKRLFAYSSVEHMGILAIGVSFGVPVALAGVLLHVLAHAAAKGNAFMGAGVLLRKRGVKHVSGVRGDGEAGGGLDLLPWSGPLLLATVLALSALPPFGVFRSEFLIVTGGFASSHNAIAAVLVILVTVAFFGLSATANRTLLGPAPDRPGRPGHPGAAALTRGEPSAWMVVPVLAGLAALLVLGLHPPAHLTELLTRGAAELGGAIMTGLAAATFAETLAGQVAEGGRFAGLFGTATPDGVQLSAHIASHGTVQSTDVLVAADSYPSVTRRLGAAFWYEREVQDVFGLRPVGHPRPEPLIFPCLNGANGPLRPGREGEPGPAEDPDPALLPRHVMGPGLFTIPHGPVRSGVMESMEYLVETPGEDIPHLNMRVFYKHRGIEKRFEGMQAVAGPDVKGPGVKDPGQAAEGVLLAERVEGTASIAHALAYCHALERIAGCEVPAPARLVRLLHAELERIAGYLEVAVRLADAAGLAVATSRFGWHKERVLRLVSRLCGSRFGRGVVRPGGVAGLPRLPAGDVLAELGSLQKVLRSDAAALMETSSFLDRLRGTGPLSPGRAREHGALGPIGRASGFADDPRFARPYDGYADVGFEPPGTQEAGDALARLRVRVDELDRSFGLIRSACEGLGLVAGEPVRAKCAPADGRGIGWAEAPQGEVLYDVRLAGGRIVRCRPRSASFHNLVLMHEVFAGDILTDFPFIEASFGLSVAGVSL